MDTETLVLHPIDPFATPGERIAALRAAGLIGTALPGPVPTFEPGAAFAELVSFLGCSPQLRAGETPRHSILVPPPQPRPTLLAHGCTITPVCPACRAPIRDWRNAVEDWQHNQASRFACPGCGASLAVPMLRWRDRAGLGRYEIVIAGIAEGTALPSDALLTLLESLGAGPWRHFFDRRHL